MNQSKEPLSLVPPRVTVPIVERLAWYEKAIERLGGTPWPSATGKPEDQLFYHIDTYADLGGPQRKLKDYFDPPLETPRPGQIPGAHLAAELEKWVGVLGEHRISVSVCDHMSASQALREIAERLESEGSPPPENGFIFLMLSESCEECDRELLEGC